MKYAQSRRKKVDIATRRKKKGIEDDDEVSHLRPFRPAKSEEMAGSSIKAAVRFLHTHEAKIEWDLPSHPHCAPLILLVQAFVFLDITILYRCTHGILPDHGPRRLALFRIFNAERKFNLNFIALAKLLWSKSTRALISHSSFSWAYFTENLTVL